MNINQNDILSVLLLRNSDGSWALTLFGPNGQDRLRGTQTGILNHGDCPTLGHCDVVEIPGAFSNCEGRGWIPTQNLGDMLEAARMKWSPHYLGGVFHLEVEHANPKRTGHYRADIAETTIEAAVLSCIRQALQTEGATL